MRRMLKSSADGCCHWWIDFEGVFCVWLHELFLKWISRHTYRRRYGIGKKKTFLVKYNIDTQLYAKLFMKCAR